MESTLKVDWLSITIPHNRDMEMSELENISLWSRFHAKPYTCDTSTWRHGKPMFGYTQAYQSTRGTIAMFGRLEMGLHIIYSGQALQALSSDGIEVERVIENAVKYGAKATRIDVALDMYNGVFEVQDYSNSLSRGAAVTASKTWREIKNSEGGATLYIGSRASERMVRIYDKKAERARAFELVGSDSWIRAEVEFKGDRAKNLMKAFSGNDIDDVLRSHLIDAIDFPTNVEWKQATRSGATTVEVSSTVRKLTKTRHWLMTTVAQTIAKEVAQDGEFYAQLLSEVNVQIERLLGKIDPDVDTNK